MHLLFNILRNEGNHSFWCTFSERFFHKSVPYLIFYKLTEFQCNTFFLSQDMKQDVLISSYLVN